MVAYSFKKHFAAPIQARTKRQTLRAPGRRMHAIPGQTLHLYTAMRTKHCRLIGLATCTGLSQIRLDFDTRRVESLDTGTAWTTEDETNAFAERDGFEDWNALRRFWAVEHPGVQDWTGFMIRWGDTFRLPPP